MSEYDDNGYFRNGLATPENVRRHCGNQPPGKVIALGHAPPGILIFKKFLNPVECQQIVAYANQQAGAASTVQQTDSPDGVSLESRLSSERVTEYIDIQGMEESALAVVRNVFVGHASPHYDLEIDWFERPEVLRYKPGGYYKPHADADNWNRTQRTWTRGMDRDISALIYLNDEFSGGELEFTQFGFLIRPEAGMLVCFPSDHRYVHAARPTTDGVRYVIVSWAAAKNTERVRETPPPGAVVC